MKKFSVVCEVTGVELKRYDSIPEANERAHFYSELYGVDFGVYEVLPSGHLDDKNLIY